MQEQINAQEYTRHTANAAGLIEEALRELEIAKPKENTHAKDHLRWALYITQEQSGLPQRLPC